jgi:hypothetical protein
VLDASGQALAYACARETREQANIAKVLTFYEARRIAVNVAKLPELLEALLKGDHKDKTSKWFGIAPGGDPQVRKPQRANRKC